MDMVDTAGNERLLKTLAAGNAVSLYNGSLAAKLTTTSRLLTIVGMAATATGVLVGAYGTIKGLGINPYYIHGFGFLIAFLSMAGVSVERKNLKAINADGWAHQKIIREAELVANGFVDPETPASFSPVDYVHWVMIALWTFAALKASNMIPAIPTLQLFN